MMSTNNKNYVNDVNESISQVKPRPAGDRLGTPRSSISKTPKAFESYAEALVRKISNNLHQPSLADAPPMCLQHVWRGEWRQRRVFVLVIMYVAYSRVNHHQLLLGNWNILTLTGKELELVEEAKRYHLDIVEVLPPKDVALKLWI